MLRNPKKTSPLSAGLQIIFHKYLRSVFHPFSSLMTVSGLSSNSRVFTVRVEGLLSLKVWELKSFSQECLSFSGSSPKYRRKQFLRAEQTNTVSFGKGLTRVPYNYFISYSQMIQVRIEHRPQCGFFLGLRR